MEALPVVERLNELKHGRLRVLTGMEPLLMHQFILERAEEALDDGVVVTIALATHTAHQPMLSQQALVGHAGIEGPLIAVMNEPGSRTPLPQRHLQRLKRDVLIRFGTHRPADDASRV